MMDKTQRKATNVTLDAGLLSEAKALGINLSRTLEIALAEKVREEKSRRWAEENHEALEDYNRRIDQRGCFQPSP